MTLLSDQYLYRPMPLHVLSAGRFNSMANMVAFFAAGGGFSGSSTWPAANRAFYIPMTFPSRFVVARFLVCNGSIVSGDFDAGLYSAAGARLISTGTTAQTGTSVVQYVDVADQSFPPGNYYLALVHSGGGRIVNTASTGFNMLAQATGMTLENLGSTVLPSTMTPAASTARQVYPCFGFSQSDTL